MPLVSITRPAMENLSLDYDRLRVQQHFADNIDYINRSFAQVSFSAVHNTEVLITNPYGVTSIRFPTVALSSYAVNTTSGLVEPVAYITISAPRDDNQIGLTVFFPSATVNTVTVSAILIAGS